MTQPSQINTRPGVGAGVAALVRGATITTGAGSAYVAIPDTLAGAPPNRIRLAATAACYARLGGSTEATVVESAAGSGYAPLDTITLTGGTFNSPMKLRVDTTKLVSTARDAIGTGYAVNDVITLSGGTAVTRATLTLSTIQLASLALNAGGAGYAVNDTITLAGGTNTTAAVVTVLTETAGIIGTFFITTRGNYTVGSASFTQASTSGGGTGATFNAGLFGVRTFTISDDGEYSANTTSFTQHAVAPSGGTAATFNTALYGPETATVTDDGDYTVNPSNPVSQGSTSGAGTGATWTVAFMTAAAAGDLLVQPGDAIIVDAVGYDQVAAIQVTGAGILQIQPLEN